MISLQRKLIFIFLVITFSGLGAQDIQMEITPNPVGRGDRFSIDFFIDYEDMNSVFIKPPVLPHGISLFKGPYKRPYWLQNPDGSSRKKTLVTYTYSTNKEGRFEIAPFSINLGDSLFQTEPNIIRVGLYKNRELYMPYSLNWSFNSAVFYEGQAIPAVLEVIDLEEVIFFNDVLISPPDAGFVEPVNNLGQVEVRVIGDISLYTVPVRGFIFTPSSAGKMRIPPSTVTSRGITSSTKTVFLDIQKIPAEISKTGAIGQFTASVWLEDSSLERNENIELHVKIEGIGNLNYFELQVPAGKDLTLVNTQEILDYTPSNEGYTGSRETVYTYISDSPGNKNLIIPAFPYLNPKTDIVSKGNPGNLTFNIKEGLNSSTENTVETAFPFSPKRVDSGRFSSTDRYKDPVSYLWLLPGPLVLLIFLIAGRKKFFLGVSIIFIAAAGQIIPNPTVDLAIDKYEMGEYAESVKIFLEAKNELPDNSYLSYNLALANYQIGDYGKSIFYAREAYYQDPLNKEYRSLVDFVEKKGDILYPIELSFNFYPDAFLFLLMIFVNIGSFIGVIYLVKKRAIYFIVSVLVFALSILSLGGLGFSIIQKDRQVGIIQEQVLVKKIPLSQAETVVDMKPGESVLVKGYSDNFLFINTGTGNKGWIESSKIMILED